MAALINVPWSRAMSQIAWMDPDKIQFVTIHCTATPEGRANTAAEVTQWDIERFGQPSYHYVIELDGKVTKTLRHDQRGAHTGGHNTGNIGISYVGGTESLNAGGKPKDTRTPEQLRELEHTLRNVLMVCPHAVVRGHRDWPDVHKACPSFDVHNWLNEIGLGRYFG
jgi:N-acetyl-anhydromuramyl-L-alanine amidase AmpD